MRGFEIARSKDDDSKIGIEFWIFGLDCQIAMDWQYWQWHEQHCALVIVGLELGLAAVLVVAIVAVAGSGNLSLG